MKSVLIIGLGRFGTYMAKKFTALGNHVMALDTDEEKVNEILPFVTTAQIGDATKESVLESIGVDNFDLCVVSVGAALVRAAHIAHFGHKDHGFEVEFARRGKTFPQSEFFQFFCVVSHINVPFCRCLRACT